MRKQKLREQLPKKVAIGAVLLVVGLLSTAAIGGYKYEKDWTGVNESIRVKESTQDIRREKTLWDWLQLLIVPATVAGASIWFNWAQRNREREIEDERRLTDLYVGDERAQDDALQAYLDYMGQQILEGNLRDARTNKSAATVARARTLAVLTRLNKSQHKANNAREKNRRKRSLLQFLYESRMINGMSPIVDLSHADLSDIDLSLTPGVGAGSGADIARFELGGAVLKGVILARADLSDANLKKANLSGASLFDANLRGAKLSGAILQETFLAKTQLQGADLSGVDLTGAVGLTVNQKKHLKSFPSVTLPDGSRSQPQDRDDDNEPS